MSTNPFRLDPDEDSLDDRPWDFPPLPGWLADRILRPDEKITWVIGPKWQPWWERYATHPLLFLIALVLGAGCVAAGRLSVDSWAQLHPVPAVVAIGLVFGSIFVLGGVSGWFTRLVVTNFRLVILQGREVCRSWNIDDLPPSLVHYGKPQKGEPDSPTIDLDALKTMLGSKPSDKFVDADTIMTLGKHLDQIRPRKDDRP
jgi:hypothetical protein